VSKQRKPAKGHEVARSEQQERASERAPAELEAQTQLGNQALQAQLEEGPTVDAAEQVRESARALADRGALALHLEARPPEQVARLERILSRSALPQSQKSALQDRVTGAQDAAVEVQEAVERAFGVDTADLRTALIDTLDRVSAAVRAAELDGSEQVETVLAELVASHGVGELAEQAEAVVNLCQDLLLVLLWDEEEDEEYGDAAPFEE